jgi:hypothetical protein
MRIGRLGQGPGVCAAAGSPAQAALIASARSAARRGIEGRRVLPEGRVTLPCARNNAIVEVFDPNGPLVHALFRDAVYR